MGDTGRKEDTERKDNSGPNMYLGLPLHNCIRGMRNLWALAALGYFLVLLLLLLLHWTCWPELNEV